MSFQPIVDAIMSLDKSSTTINIGLAVLLLKQYFSINKKIESLLSEIAILKEKANATERDIDSLESTYQQTNTELRHYLRYNDGKITRLI